MQPKLIGSLRHNVLFAAALSLFALTLAFALYLGAGAFADDPPPPDEPLTEDMDNDGEEDEIVPDTNDPNQPGSVEIISGEDGQIIVTFSGVSDNDKFGYSFAVINDLNLDGHKDLIIGAPQDEDGGRAYVFYGPFSRSGPMLITAASANMAFRSPDLADSLFGERVGPVSDLDGDGATDLRIRAWFYDEQLNPPSSNTHTYIISGLTGAPLYQITGDDPFDPWAEVAGDADGDGDVDQDDIDLIELNLGREVTPGTARSGDVDGDGFVDGADLAIATAMMGENHFANWGFSAATVQCTPGEALPPGYTCRPNCRTGQYEVLPINAETECRPPIICPGPGCAIDIEPDIAPSCFECISEIQCVFTRINFYRWAPVCGNDTYAWSVPWGLVMKYASPDEEFPSRLLSVSRVIHRCVHSCCAGMCQADVNVISAWIDTDRDGLPDALEETIGLDPFDADTDGDDVRDGDEQGPTHLTNLQQLAAGYWPGLWVGSGTIGPVNVPAGYEGLAGVHAVATGPPDCGYCQDQITEVLVNGETFISITPGEPLYVCPGDALRFYRMDCGYAEDVQWFITSPTGPPTFLPWWETNFKWSPPITVPSGGDGGGTFYVNVLTMLGGTPCVDNVQVVVPTLSLDVPGELSVDEGEAYVAALVTPSPPTSPTTIGLEVEFTIRRNGLFVQVISSIVEDGIAVARFDVSTVPGDVYQVQARPMGFTGSANCPIVTDSFNLVPGAPAAFETSVAPAAVGADGTRSIDLSVTVRDQFENLVADATDVSWIIADAVSTFTDVATTFHGQTVHGQANATVIAPKISDAQFPLRVRVSATPKEAEIIIPVSQVTGTLSASQMSLDVATGQSTLITMTTDATDGTPVFWTMSNGVVRNAETMVTAGSSTLAISSLDNGNGLAHVGPCYVTATVGDELAWLRIDFVDSRPFHVTLQRSVICGDVLTNGTATVPYAQVEFITGNPPVIPPDTHVVPYWAQSLVTIRGEPGATCWVTLQDQAHSTYVEFVGLDNENKVELDSIGIGTFTIRSRGNYTSATPLNVRFKAVHSGIALQGQEERVETITIVEHGFWSTTLDGLTSFFGGDPQTATGIGANMAGGIFIVGDVGAIVKNCWRAAGFSDKPPDNLEVVLSGLGLATELAVGIGEVADVPISGTRAIVAAVGNNPFTNTLVSLVKQAVISGNVGHLAGLGAFVAKLKNGVNLQVVNQVFNSPALAVAGIKATDDLGEEVGERLIHRLKDIGVDGAPAGLGGVASARAVTDVLGASDLTSDVLAGLKAVGEVNPAKFDEAVFGIAKAARSGLDPALLKAVLNNPHVLTVYPSHADLLIDIGRIAPVGSGDNIAKLGFKKVCDRMKSPVANFARGGAYEVRVAAELAGSGGQAKYVERFVNTELGKTDIDTWLLNSQGQNVMVQAKITPAAFDVEKERIWIAKAAKFAETQGFPANIMYVSSVPQGQLPAAVANMIQHPPSGVVLTYKFVPLPQP